MNQFYFMYHLNAASKNEKYWNLMEQNQQVVVCKSLVIFEEANILFTCHISFEFTYLITYSQVSNKQKYFFNKF